MGSVCTSDDKKNEAIEKVSMDTDQKQPEGEVQLEAPEPKLLISIVGARGLRDSDWLPGSGKPDCYCEVKTGDTVLHTTAVQNDKCEPCWFEECKVNEIADDAPLEFNVYDKDLIGSDFLGKAVIQAKDYNSEGWNSEIKLEQSKVEQAYIKIKVKLAGKDLPPGPKPEIEVTIEKPAKDKSFGLDLDTQDETRLHVLEVKAGPFFDYNQGAKMDMQVKPNDVIMSVNDVAGSTNDMLDQFKKELKVKCVIRRAIMSTVIFDKPKDVALGMEFPDKPQGEFLVVKTITGGATEAYNNAAKEHEKIGTGDRIVAVSGKKEKAAGLLKLLEEKEGKVQLTVMRPAFVKADAGGGLPGFIHWLFE